MRLIELLSVCSENTVIVVWDVNDRFVTEYDGKNSIDEKYNDCRVLGISGVSDCREDRIDVIVEVENA